MDRRTGWASATELMRLQRLAALGLLAGSLAHEFNNLFTTIINTAKLTLDDDLDDRQRRSIERILRAATRAADLSKTILGYARGEDEAPRCDPAAVVEDVLLLSRKELQRHGVRAEVELEPTAQAAISAVALQQVLLNLVLNACDAMPDGGTLTISLRPIRRPRGIELVVADTGTGIPRQQLKRVFEPFFTTKSGSADSQGGTGLGLAICRELVCRAGGRIRVESKVGAGTRFIIRLPAAEEGAGPTSRVA